MTDVKIYNKDGYISRGVDYLSDLPMGCPLCGRFMVNPRKLIKGVLVDGTGRDCFFEWYCPCCNVIYCDDSFGISHVIGD